MQYSTATTCGHLEVKDVYTVTNQDQYCVYLGANKLGQEFTELAEFDQSTLVWAPSELSRG